ncbi:MAG: hypothetical protein RBU30_00845 [Polyangia bacterium]|jgi:hypothetical protein|nr:hypothetical protein [Polyangia bacterium]
MDRLELDSEFDPEKRELCPDGACLGVIGPDGRCGECGALSPNPPKAPSGQATGAVSASPKTEAEQKKPPGPRETEEDDFDPDRRELCSDGACLGVIGPDGRCKLCGRAGHGSVGDSR